jgi:hypothetical protein
MFRLVKSFLKALLPTSVVDQIVQRRRIRFHVKSYGPIYLNLKGWERSAIARESVNGDGQPIPWITYPAQMMLERVVMPTHRVFEYGAGNSSLWWASRVTEIVSVEHDEAWAAKVAARAPTNLQVFTIQINQDYVDEGALVDAFFASQRKLPTTGMSHVDLMHGLLSREFGAYALQITKFPKGYFDIIVIDGMARVLTSWVAVHYLNPEGFIVFDNSNRWQYNEAYEILADFGFKRIDFYGIAPVNAQESCTSIFARDLVWAKHNVCIPVGLKSEVDIP